MKLELCLRCAERTVEVIVLNEEGTQTKSVCHTCDFEIENPVICGGCGAPNERGNFELLNCGFCGCSEEAEVEEEEEYAECPHCSNEYNVFDDNTGSGMCEDCRDAYSSLGDDELMDSVCSEFGVYPYDVEYDRTYEEMEIDGFTYKVYTDDTIEEVAREYIEQTLWAFNPYFLSNETGIDSTIFEILMDSGKCESLNEGLMDIIEKTCGMDEFVEDAISEDGLEHFLNDSYTTVDSQNGTLYLIP